MNQIPLVDLKAAHAEVAEELRAGFDRVLADTAFIGGAEVRAFEQEYAGFAGVGHCVGVANGTDALELALRASGVGVGDEVVLPANTFIATAGAVARIGARPVLVDCLPDTLLMDPQAALDAVGTATRAVVPVHLYGQCADAAELAEHLPPHVAVVEDAAQSQGATRRGRSPGSGTIAATSFYPGKNLGAYGDAGAVVTDDAERADLVRALANHGGVAKYRHDVAGFNSRLDGLQAVVLRAKLARLAEGNAARRAAADRYGELLGDLAADGRLTLPVTAEATSTSGTCTSCGSPERTATPSSASSTRRGSARACTTRPRSTSPRPSATSVTVAGPSRTRSRLRTACSPSPSSRRSPPRSSSGSWKRSPTPCADPRRREPDEVPMKRRTRSLRHGLFTVAAALLATALPPAAVAGAADPCGPTTNAIVCENSKPGTPTEEWFAPSAYGDIKGFPDRTSVQAGETLHFKVQSPTSYKVSVYRLGHYGGTGARLMSTAAQAAQTYPANFAPGGNPAACTTKASTGLVDCGNWPTTASWTVPADAVSGLYVANFDQADGNGVMPYPFVVRKDSSHSDIVVQTSDQTWQAYNNYGGQDLYDGGGPAPDGRAYEVSYNRPMDIGGDNGIYGSEFQMVAWLERNGYDVSYMSGIDMSVRGATLLQNHKVFMSSGHDEYWTQDQFTNA